jgi:hypothetical protein
MTSLSFFVEQTPTGSYYFPDCCLASEALVRIKGKNRKSLTVEDIVRLEFAGFNIFITNSEDLNEEMEERRKDEVHNNRNFSYW